jgi:hypothetical protein
MEKVTTYNYEAFYLDYLEGNLSERGVAMLFEFLKANPVLKNELEFDNDILDYSLSQDLYKLDELDKAELKQFDCKADEICLNNVNDFIIADIEGDISVEKKTKLNEFIIEHDLQNTTAYFDATKLKPNLAEVYQNKAELKKKGRIIPLLLRVGSVAAVLLIGFNIMNTSNDSKEIYTSRTNQFELKLDSSNHEFNIEVSNNNIASSGSKTAAEIKNSTVKVNGVKDSIVEPSIQIDFNNNVVENIEKGIDNQPDLPIIEKDLNDDIVASNINENPNSNIQLVDMYKPATNIANSYTNLNVVAKKSTPESDYQVTAFSVGKFSFERKRKK